MRRIAHISDLHFGTEEPAVVAGVRDELNRLACDLVVVTGDLTQRARQSQFAAARAFLDSLESPWMAVPGNHDIPLYNVAARFGWPLAGYQKWITADLRPTFADAELAVAGVNTARSDTWKDGRVGESDIAHVREFFGRQATGALKVLAAHHPFIPPDRDPGEAIVGRAKLALAMLAESGCSLILAGHLHHAYAGDVRPHHVEVQRSILVVQAGTAMSRRRRDEANAFNLLSIDQGGLELDVRTWQGSAFATSGKRLFEYGESGWAVRPA